MKAVILAAGEGVRMRPLTLENPKPLLKVNGVPIIERLISQLPEKVDELIVVIGYLGEKIQNYLGDEFMGRKVNYVWQKEQRGTYDALAQVRHLLDNEPFAVFFADDILNKETFSELLSYPLAIVAAEVTDPRPFGVIVPNPDGTVADIEEKPENPKSHLVLTTAYVLTPQIFNYAPAPHLNGEIYLSTAMSKMAKEHPIKVVKAKMWIPIGTPDDILKAEAALKNPIN
jgi:UDP-N-acetylglucosamine diphosphorylase / glucose-1-phosphate thymidylyltransferase / UDP-N-acetylgalactosamine diphosphorylase / glucosamine-1-phosphate N-acetyltransferase / galactosamine-1-phosphate N-acetyltransferase